MVASFIFLKGSDNMKLAEIKAVLHTKAKAAKNIKDAQAVPPLPIEPTTKPAPVANPPASAKPKVVNTATNNTVTPVNQASQPPTQPVASQQVIAQTPPPPVPTKVTPIKSNESITPAAPTPAVPIQQAKPKTSKAKTTPISNNEDIEAIVAKYLRPGVDYAVIPHTTKPSLLKGGAERLAFVFGFRVSCEIINRIENFDPATPANSFVQYESKVSVYNRDGAVVSEGYGSCNSAESKFLKQPFANRVNTVLKMSKKRAYVDAILTATCASSVFTQDMEDIANFQETAK